MVDLAEVNTRMKDFYDVYHLLINHPVNDSILEQAIKATFQRRNTPTPANHSLFESSFYQDEFRIRLWQAWLKKTGLEKNLEFEFVMRIIQERLIGIYRDLSINY